MSNVHRLPPAPKIKRHGVIVIEIDDSIGVRELSEALATRGFCMARGVTKRIRVERMKRGAHG